MKEDPQLREALDDELKYLHGVERPWSGKALVRLGKSIRSADSMEGVTEDYVDVMAHYQILSMSVQSCIEAECNSDRDEGQRFAVTSRAKSIDTLAEKLRRTPSLQLPAIRDMAGVRVEGSMELSEQTELAESLCRLFGHGAEAIHDLRTQDHSGYRAVHLWLEFPAGRVEVQVRTTLQGAWANAYEKAADFFGREIRYGKYPDDAELKNEVEELQLLSTERIALIERLGDDILIAERGLPGLREEMESQLASKAHKRKRIHKKRIKIVERRLKDLPNLEDHIARMKQYQEREKEDAHKLAQKLERAYMMMANS
ncbi:hypothetical protein [Glutamicibacter nicotianae]|uniref:hypothetical protein n=1 Tax=Glutamicibacter nicotianae TaxID=37929 RepID=UPI000EF86041